MHRHSLSLISITMAKDQLLTSGSPEEPLSLRGVSVCKTKMDQKLPSENSPEKLSSSLCLTIRQSGTTTGSVFGASLQAWISDPQPFLRMSGFRHHRKCWESGRRYVITYFFLLTRCFYRSSCSCSLCRGNPFCRREQTVRAHSVR